MIPRHDDLRARRKRTFQYSVVWLVAEHLQRFGRFDEFPELGEEDGDTRKCFTVVGKLASQDREQLVNDGARKSERVLATDYLAERFISPSARKRESRHQYVGVKYDYHARRYRCRSSSVRMPSSFARRLQ